MNNIYLKKLIQQETLNVKLQLVQEHLQLAKEEFSQKQKDLNKTNNLNVLSEQDNTSDEWPAPKDKVQQFFKNLQKKGIPVKEKSSTTPPNYEVTINIDPSTIKGSKRTASYKNLFQFYEDGSVYDFNQQKTIGYAYDNNKIQLLSKNPDAIVSTAVSNVILATIDSQGRFNQTADAGADVDPGAEYKSWLDPLQQILDYAGLIPVIGDALDAINACIYFWRGRYFEGFLSLIAIIPVVGSVISLGVKSALKAGAKGLTKAGATGLIKRWWLKGDPKAIESLGVSLHKTGGLSVNQMSDISSAFNGFGKKTALMSNSTKKFFGAGAVTKNLDDAANTLTKAGKGWDDAVIGLKAADKVKDTTKRSFSLFRTSKKVLNSLTLNFLPRLKKLPFYPDKKLAKMAIATEERFIATTLTRPDRLGFLTKFGSKQQRDVVVAQMQKQIKGLTVKDQKKVLQVLADTPSLKKYTSGNIVDLDSLLRSTDGTTAFFTKFGKESPEISKNLAETLVNQSIKNENVLWSGYKSNKVNEIISGGFSKGVQLQFAKNVDIIYDELQLAGAGMGFDSPEQLKEVGLVPLTKWAILSAMPGTYAVGAKQLEQVGELTGRAKDQVEIFAGSFGFQFDALSEYEPIGAEEYTYEEDID